MTSDNDSHRLLTVAETCERLHISRPTFYGLVHSGALQTITIGRARRVPLSAIAQFVDAQLATDGRPGRAEQR